MNIKEFKNFKRKKYLFIFSLVFIILILLSIFIALFYTGTNKAFDSEKDIAQVKSEREEKSKKKLQIYQDEENYWNINTEKYRGILGGKNNKEHDILLKVLQLTDIHFGCGYKSILNDKKTINAINEIIKWSKPDIIVVTGDAIYPMPFTSGSLNNGKSTKNFCDFMNKFKIPWAFVYGNHDTESYATDSKKKISQILLENKYNGKDKFCLYQEGPNNFYNVKNGEKPLGNYPILLRENNILKHVMMFMDSNKYNSKSNGPPFFKYDNIHEDQAEWYKKVLIKISEKNGYTSENPVTSSLFFHIPIKQYKEAWEKVTDDHIEKESDKRNKIIKKGVNKEDSKIKYFGGDMQEYTRDPKDTTISCSTLESPIWNAIKELKSTKFLFCGHDHDNNFSIEYEGVRLTYGKSIDYQAYPGISKRTFQRGCTVLLLTGEEKNNAIKIYQKKLAMLNKEQISDMNFQKSKIEDVYNGTENPKMLHPMTKIYLIISIVLVCILTLFFYLIFRKIFKNKKKI